MIHALDGLLLNPAFAILSALAKTYSFAFFWQMLLAGIAYNLKKLLKYATPPPKSVAGSLQNPTEEKQRS